MLRSACTKVTRAVSSAGRAPALQAGGRRFDPVTAHVEAAQVSLLRWLRRQLRQPTPLREHLEAAVENDDPAEARRLRRAVRVLGRTAAERRPAPRRVGTYTRPRGPVAQSVEQGTFNPKVAGSIPARPIPRRRSRLPVDRDDRRAAARLVAPNDAGAEHDHRHVLAEERAGIRLLDLTYDCSSEDCPVGAR